MENTFLKRIDKTAEEFHSSNRDAIRRMSLLYKKMFFIRVDFGTYLKTFFY